MRLVRPGLILLLALLVLCPRMSAAQAPEADKPVQVGDKWVYRTKNEITGLVTRTFAATVTETSPTQITMRAYSLGSNGGTVVIFDHDWNRVVNGPWRYDPNDGHGVRRPLAVGKEWRSDFVSNNVQSGTKFMNSNFTKVTAQGSVTTPAGTFDAFKVERQLKGYNAADRSKLTETTFVLWFAPQINHWVRQTVVTKFNKRLTTNETDELIEYARPQ